MSQVALSNLDKVFWPAAGFTKGDMVEYYRRVAPVLLPGIAGRPVTLRRFPDGVEGDGWYQNECRGRPEWLRTAPVRDRAGKVWNFCLVEDVPSLLWVVNLGTIELHPLLPPDVVAFDLDPGPPADILDCCRVALQIRERIPEAVVKTTGSVGLHVVAPAATDWSFVRELPGVVSRRERAARAGKVLVEAFHDEPLRSIVAPYSLRAMPWPTVATPVTWEEIEQAVEARRPELLTFLPGAVLERLGL